jgi:predicted lipoprotein with Yx(FWY)xxD motif
MKLMLIVLALVTALVLGACGGSDDGDATASTASTTVSLDDGVLVDSSGKALYSSDQEKSGKVVCTSSCVTIWLPLEAPGSGDPTAGDGVSGKLGAIKRPDGSRQVTLDGRPLYRFAQDSAPGKATGDDVTDSFDGQQFTWHAEGTGAESGKGGGGDEGGRSYSY